MLGAAAHAQPSRIQTPPAPLQRRARTAHTPTRAGCAPLKVKRRRRRHSPARSTCGLSGFPQLTLLASVGADMVSKSRNGYGGHMSADMLFTLGLLALMPPTIVV